MPCNDSNRIEDGSGAQEFAYGPMGEIIRKTVSLVDLNQFAYTFSSFWQYDSWGRIRKIVYPDGEEVTYHYDSGGKLNAIHSSNGDSYLEEVYYDKFENKVMEALGNGTQMLYSYSADMRRLSDLKAHYAGNYFLDVSYSYDQVGNITGIQNTAGSKDNLGGAFSHQYSYDALYRLANANGSSGSSHYQLEMAYTPSGNIRSKTVMGQLTDMQQGSFPVNYNHDYGYNGSAPHQVAGIIDQNSGSSFNFEWDLNGNMSLHSEMIQGITKQRRLCWDEENRLLLSADEEQLAGYVYDAAGMRTHKASGTIAVSTVNGYPSYFGSISSMTLYPSELITVSTGMYTKHYYNGSQRLASRIGGGFAPHPDLNHYDPLTDQVELPHSRDYQRKAQALVDLWTRQAECAGLQPSLEFAYTLAEGNLHNPLSEPADGERYFYHSDHLGSSAFITSENGYATQFLAYLPFGETLNEEQNSSNYYSPFKFSAKEKDPETGYSYFGARYYSPDLSVWLSVDPLSDKYPSLSAYNYCAWNPVMLVDPDGRDLDVLENQSSRNDLLSIVSVSNRNRVKINNGTVTVNTEGLSEKDLQRDIGLTLIKDLVDSDKKFLFESVEIAYFNDENCNQKAAPISILDKNGIINASNLGKDGENRHLVRPADGYDGHVMISSSGRYFSATEKTEIKRSSVIFHELAENYFRTHFQYDYHGNYSNAGYGAHYRAESLEGHHFGNPSPGNVTYLRGNINQEQFIKESRRK